MVIKVRAQKIKCQANTAHGITKSYMSMGNDVMIIKKQQVFFSFLVKTKNVKSDNNQQTNQLAPAPTKATKKP